MQISRFIFQIIAPFKMQLAFWIFVSIIWAVELSLKPYLIKCALDSVLLATPSQPSQLFLYYLFLYFFLMVGLFIINTVYEYIWIDFFPQFKINIGNQIFETLLSQPYTFYQNQFAGSLTTKLNNCMGAIPRLLKCINEDFFRYFLAILISSYTLWHVSFKFSLGMLIWAGSYVASALFMAPLVKKRSISVAREASKGMGYMLDIVSNIISVKLFTHNGLEKKIVNRNFERWKNLIQDRDRILVHLFTFQTLSFIAFQGLCVYWLEVDNTLGTINAGDFILVFSISFSIYSCLMGLTRTIADYSENLGTVAEALEVIYSFKDQENIGKGIALQVCQGRIVFESVTFHFSGSQALFQNESVTIEGGQKVGLVGYSGSGKSTFVNLILQLYKVTEGRILIDDQNIEQVSEDSLRSQITLIPQDPVLFHRSLKDNIRYGRIEATDEEVIKAATKAHAHEFIVKLPQSYDSLVGERGVKLSGGQRQRVAIARAILKDAPILILDEATSQLDSVTENLIQESLWQLMQGKTTLVIAHRLSTLLHMDRILVFDKGKIVEDGTHTELLAKHGLYKQLWDTQVGGFLRDNKKEEA